MDPHLIFSYRDKQGMTAEGQEQFRLLFTSKFTKNHFWN